MLFCILTFSQVIFSYCFLIQKLFRLSEIFSDFSEPQPAPSKGDVKWLPCKKCQVAVNNLCQPVNRSTNPIMRNMESEKVLEILMFFAQWYQLGGLWQKHVQSAPLAQKPSGQFPTIFHSSWYPGGELHWVGAVCRKNVARMLQERCTQRNQNILHSEELLDDGQGKPGHLVQSSRCLADVIRWVSSVRLSPLRWFLWGNPWEQTSSGSKKSNSIGKISWWFRALATERDCLRHRHQQPRSAALVDKIKKLLRLFQFFILFEFTFITA